MRVQEIREARQANPFLPFTMHLADGREFTVIHPDFAWVSPNGRFAVVEDLDGHCEYIDPMMVVSLSIPAKPTKPAKSPAG